jgi:hypothetical protein
MIYYHLGYRTEQIANKDYEIHDAIVVNTTIS